MKIEQKQYLRFIFLFIVIIGLLILDSVLFFLSEGDDTIKFVGTFVLVIVLMLSFVMLRECVIKSKEVINDGL